MARELDVFRSRPMMRRGDPFGISSILDDFPFGGSLLEDFLGPMGQELEESTRLIMPPVDVEETDKHFVVRLDVPGIPMENISIDVEGDQLVISGERVLEREEGGRRRRVERSYGRFMRTLLLPSHADKENIEAHYKNGVLALVIPKREAVQAKKIEVKSGEGPRLVKGQEEEQRAPAGEIPEKKETRTGKEEKAA